MKPVFARRFGWTSLVVLLAGLAAAGCTVLGAPSQVPAMDVTQAYRTVDARLTQAAASVTLTPATVLPSPTPFNRSVPSLTSTVQRTPVSTSTPAMPTPSPSPTIACDQASAGNPIDVTIPDDTQMIPGQSFTKIWRLVNVGGCTWTEDYAARFFYGAQMNAPDLVYLSQPVKPGQSVEIAVDMVAPNNPGPQQGNWKLRNASGAFFGIGPNGDAPFWVRIVVVQLPTSTSTPSSTPVPTQTPTLTSSPTFTPTATPVIRASGTVQLKIGDLINLDNGEVNGASGQDLAYQDSNGFHLLVPQGNALVGIFGSQEPGLPACQTASMSAAPIALESLSVGIYLCYRTDQGLPGWLRYTSYNSVDGSASLDFRTWELP